MATSKDRALEKDVMTHLGIVGDYYRDAQTAFNSELYSTTIQKLTEAMFNLGRADSVLIQINDFEIRQTHRKTVIRYYQKIKNLSAQTARLCPGRSI